MPSSGTHGYFLDGLHPLQQPVSVSVESNVLRFRCLEARQTITWDFASIDWDATRQLPDQLRLKHDGDDARLVVTDAAQIAAILAEKNTWARHHFWTLRRETLTILRASATTLALAATLWLSWPWLVTPLTSLIPDSTRDWLAETAQSAVGMNRECRDPTGVAALRALTDRLTVGDPAFGRVQVGVAHSNMINALTLANDKILLTSALVTKANSSDEVAGVIAHELGHVAHRHILRGALGQLTLKFLVLVFTGAHGAEMGYVNDLTALAHTRGFEAEADTAAIDLLRRARISAQGLEGFFQRGQNAGSGPELRYFSTHPPSAERADTMRHAVIPDATPALSTQQWQALQSICGNTAPKLQPNTIDAPAPEPEMHDL